MPLILEWLTGAIERGDPLPALAVDDTVPRLVAARAERLATRRPALRPVLSAASWSGFLGPGDLLGMLGWIEANADAVEGILAAQPGPAGVADVLTLSLLSNEDGPSMSRLLRLAGTARGPGSPGRRGNSYPPPPTAAALVVDSTPIPQTTRRKPAGP